MIVKERVLLFGAGDGAKKYLQNESEGLQVLGIVDNDKGKQGLFIHDVQILSPEAGLALLFDKIIITTQWASQVRDQLIDNHGIDEEKIIIPPKSQFKTPEPFYHLPTKQLARQIIEEFSQSAKNFGFNLYLDFGTLLGIVRDGDIIDWDDDIDFSVNHHELDVLNEWIQIEVKKIILPVKLAITLVEKQEGGITSYLFTFESDPDVFDAFKPFMISISLRKNVDDNAIHLPSSGLWYAPKKHFESYEAKLWRNVSLTLPFESKEYLSFLYGDWEVPKKNITMVDYKNLGDVGFDKIDKINTTQI